jgi:hypothetical protein
MLPHYIHVQTEKMRVADAFGKAECCYTVAPLVYKQKGRTGIEENTNVRK